MARKGLATLRTPNSEDRYVTVDSDSEDTSPASSIARDNNVIRRKSRWNEDRNWENELDDVDPAASREPLNFSKPRQRESGPEPERHQPRQASGAVGQSSTLGDALFPENFDHQPVLPSIEFPVLQDSNPATAHRHHSQQPEPEPCSRPQNPTTRSRATGRGPSRSNAAAATRLTAHTKRLSSTVDSQPRPVQIPPTQSTHNTEFLNTLEDMAGGAYIPPNQQRNMRACMVCSVVRTQQQFMTQGCPNCEDILELIGNPEQINDCTSQVFEGLITVADTSRSWVARYQRLEGYQPGVYATQVEGILPDDVIGLIESAGINYVPRDGSEQDMLPKD
ncbi:transcription elongation factor spt4 [Stemphylium lycopersici]|uniref:Transcription elongation factor SPT4 n=1 Tax=Stemphylium lycopersici TaxID=183478 RepID=A0A364N7H4_STELY|nr:transcription elongation factor spt4 [Stemphylium lycopersici]RAR02360.1 transcription elongation factor spt4 [Stemphylium lycopersici]RAR13187.1 transcription elongation factor spt4 [Stemphylium lycopersici]